MSAPEQPPPVEPSPAPIPEDAEDAPYVQPEADDGPSAPAPIEAEAEPSGVTKPPLKSAPSSSKKKIARPAKSTPGKKGDGEPKSFRPGDIVLGRLKGFPPWRESFRNGCETCLSS